jgi:hypothetical protein
MMFTVLAPLVFVLLSWQQPAAQPDAITRLVQQLEAAAAAGNREQIRALGADLEATYDLALALTTPPPSRIVVQERDRTVVNDRHRLLLEVFWERAREGRLSTWNVEITNTDGEPRIAVARRLAHVTGLFRLALSPKQFDVRNLTVTAPDLTLTLPQGTAFIAETSAGPTAIVLLGDGHMRFAPSEPAERSQIRILAGDEVLNTRFDAVFIRVRPEDFAERFRRSKSVTSSASLPERV